jgi:hypothetical protein
VESFAPVTDSLVVVVKAARIIVSGLMLGVLTRSRSPGAALGLGSGTDAPSLPMRVGCAEVA